MSALALSTEPLIRASQLQANLAALRVLGSGGQKVERALDGGMINEVRSAFALRWLPLSYEVNIAQAVFELLGEPGIRIWSHRCILETACGKAINSTTRFFGVSPAAFIRWVPRVHAQVYRNAGRMSVTTGASSETTLAILEAPPVLLNSEAAVIGLEASLHGLYDLCRVTGTVETLRDPLAFKCCWDS